MNVQAQPQEKAAPSRCLHLGHSPQGICTGCREQHQPLPGYSREELAALETEFWSDWNAA